MFSQSAYRWGSYVVKYALFPSNETQEKLATSHKIDSRSDVDQHSIWLQEWFRNNSAEFDFRIQLLESLDDQPVEDATVEWDQKKYPFRTVGKITIPAGQDCFGSKRRIFWEEKMKLNAWYGLDDMRPLGSVNRLRKNVYEASRKFREETNNTETKAIKSVDEIP